MCDSQSYNTAKNFRNRSTGSPCVVTFYEKVEIFDNLGPIEVTFCLAKRTKVPMSHASFDVNRYNESLLQCEKR